MTTDGVDELPAVGGLPLRKCGGRHSAISCAACAQIDFATRLESRTVEAEARAERAERALLKTWRHARQLDEAEWNTGQCAACEAYDGHAHNCIIPDLERRYAIANTTPDAGT